MRKRKAGEVFKKDDIKFDPDKLVGAGAYDRTHESETPGTVVKKMKDLDAEIMGLPVTVDSAVLELMQQAEQEAYV